MSLPKYEKSDEPPELFVPGEISRYSWHLWQVKRPTAAPHRRARRAPPPRPPAPRMASHESLATSRDLL